MLFIQALAEVEDGLSKFSFIVNHMPYSRPAHILRCRDLSQADPCPTHGAGISAM